MNLKRLLLFSVSFLSITLLAERVEACECAQVGQPVCDAFWQADAVFAGHLTDIHVNEADPNKEDSLPTATLHFIVEQPFRGITAAQVDVATSHGTSCDMPFKKGVRYLIYASLNPETKQLFTGLCSRTETLQHAVEDLNYIRAVTQHTVSESISGRIAKDRYEPLRQLNVQVTGGGKTWETSTDEDGNFSVSLPGPGIYKVRAFIPFAAAVLSYDDDLKIDVDATDTLTTLDYEITLEKYHCHYHELDVFKDNLHATAEITGKVLTAPGSGLDKGSVYLVKAAKPEDFFRSEKLEADGSFKFGGLAAGEYYVVLNLHNEAPGTDGAPYPRTYYPGVSALDEATKIVLVEAAKLENVTLRLSEPFSSRTISGVVEWPGGRRATGAGVKLYSRDKYVGRIDAEQDGTFSFQVYGDFEYQIQAESWETKQLVISQKVRLTADKSHGLKLVLRNRE